MAKREAFTLFARALVLFATATISSLPVIADATESELTFEALHSATYYPTDPDLGAVTLENCVSNDYTTGRKVNGTFHIAHADFDGDGQRDAVTMLKYKKDRSTEENADLIVMGNDSGRPRQLAAASLDGRAMIRELRVTAGKILIDMNSGYECDSTGCGFRRREFRRYRFEHDELVLEFSRSFPIDQAGVDLDIAEDTGRLDSIVSRVRTYFESSPGE